MNQVLHFLYRQVLSQAEFSGSVSLVFVYDPEVDHEVSFTPL